MTAPWSSYMSLERVRELHAHGFVRYHQPGVEPNTVETPGCVEGAIGNAYSAHLYHSREEEPGLFFAFKLMRTVAIAHCWGDGNKRAGWLAFVDFLAQLRLTINCSDEEGEKFVLTNLRRDEEPDLAAALKWIGDHLVNLGPLPQ